MYTLVLLSALLACAAGVPLSNTKPRLDGRIAGGNPTTIQNFPHQVSLRYNGGHICGGSIIRPNWVLTAAHCITSLSHPGCIDHAPYCTAICSLSGFTIFFTHYFTDVWKQLPPRNPQTPDTIV